MLHLRVKSIIKVTVRNKGNSPKSKCFVSRANAQLTKLMLKKKEKKNKNSFNTNKVAYLLFLATLKNKK